MADPPALSQRHLELRLALVEARVRAAVDRRRAVDPDPNDRFRGLYISDAQVDSLLDAAGPGPDPPDEEAAAFLERVEDDADHWESEGADLRVRRLQRAFGLDAYDVELLLIALAPDLDPRFERLYAYLHDDVSRRRASAGLALELCGSPLGSGAGRARLNPASPLLAGGLLMIEEPERPFLTRSLRVPDRVAGHLLGDDAPDPLVEPLATDCVVADVGDLDFLARALLLGSRLIYIRERVGAAGHSVAASALHRAGMPTVALDLNRLSPQDDPEAVAAAAAREAQLRQAGLVAGPIEVLAERGPQAVRALAEARCCVLLVGSRGWDPHWCRDAPLIIEAPVPKTEQRAAIWRMALDGHVPPELDPAEATVQFRLAPEQVVRAARAARQHAAAAEAPLTARDLHAGARAQNAAGLERLARRIEPQVSWSDLILPPDVLGQLNELTARARQRDRVLDEWGMGSKSSKGRGITALFAGDSGTGKTVSAEAMAADLGLDLYVIDLSTVVDKYIGETEKNLDRIFGEADRVNGVLLFDEADAIFGKRSEVKDARDRYANVEVAYLLQRMELFDGMAILTSNLRANVDEAFTRRLDAVIDFPMPEEEDRLRLWEIHLKHGVPRYGDIDFPFLARQFRLSGGNIRNITVAAAYLAADQGRDVGMAHLIRATEREYRKLGRMCVESEFGPYFPMLGAVTRG